MKPLQNHTKITEIQTRLKKQSYLSRSILPGPADAKMFFYLQSIKKYPDRKLHPNFYHWYVLMKQFAINSIEKWMAHGDSLEDDLLIIELTSNKINQKSSSEPQILKKVGQSSDPVVEQNTKLIKSQDFTLNHSPFIEYIMDVKIKEGIQLNIRELLLDFLKQNGIDQPDIQSLIEERRVRIVTKMQPQKFQELKNKISALQGVETFETKKKDKRFKTVNSTTNFSGDCGSPV